MLDLYLLFCYNRNLRKTYPGLSNSSDVGIAMERPKTHDKYAIFQTGGKQYQAVEGKTVAIEKIDGETGATLEFKEVLFRKNGEGEFEIGQPYLASPVKASIVKQTKDAKLIIFRFKRRKKVRVKRGHRQQKTVVRIESI